MTPDGKQLMLVDPGNNAIVIYNRAADGSLTYGSCMQQERHGGAALRASAFLAAVKSLAISPDGQATSTPSSGATHCCSRSAAAAPAR